MCIHIFQKKEAGSVRKINRIMLSVVSALLCLVLLTTTALSTTFAKYTTTGDVASDSARVAKWGITVSDLGTGLSETYENENGVTLVNSGSTGNLRIAPGTSGVLAAVRITGTPEVMYDVDFQLNSLSIGEGFRSTSDLLRDENGKAIEYFPIILTYKRTDIITDNNGNETREVKIQTTGGLCTKPGNVVTHDMGTNSRYTNISGGFLTKGEYFYNRIDTGLDEVNKPPAVKIDSIYSLEWEWKYSPSDVTPTSGCEVYQTREKDTLIGEAISANPDKFIISCQVSATITQSQGS